MYYRWKSIWLEEHMIWTAMFDDNLSRYFIGTGRDEKLKFFCWLSIKNNFIKFNN